MAACRNDLARSTTWWHPPARRTMVTSSSPPPGSGIWPRPRRTPTSSSTASTRSGSPSPSCARTSGCGRRRRCGSCASGTGNRAPARPSAVDDVVRDPDFATVDIEDLRESLDLLRVRRHGAHPRRRVPQRHLARLPRPPRRRRRGGGGLRRNGRDDRPGPVPAGRRRRRPVRRAARRLRRGRRARHPLGRLRGTPPRPVRATTSSSPPTPDTTHRNVPEMMVSVQSQLSGLATPDVVELVTKTAAEWAVSGHRAAGVHPRRGPRAAGHRRDRRSPAYGASRCTR